MSDIDRPFLYIDKSSQSKKALRALKKSHKDFIEKKVTKRNESDLDLPVLFAPQGVFQGLHAINAYIGSIFGAKEQIAH